MEDETPLSLMRKALAIYDQTGDGVTTVACDLQAAIDTPTGAKPLQPGEEIDPNVIETSSRGSISARQTGPAAPAT